VRIRVNPNPHCFIAITKAEATNLKDPLSKAENISRSYAVNRRQKYIPVPSRPVPIHCLKSVDNFTLTKVIRKRTSNFL
jgi:hypothetical protein